uniref:Letm1 RBD domain-containing protein n=1 Tax=Entomoneis paludosa TaxID=265537 RepID=A0A7S3DXE5_9STRA
MTTTLAVAAAQQQVQNVLQRRALHQSRRFLSTDRTLQSAAAGAIEHEYKRVKDRMEERRRQWKHRVTHKMKQVASLPSQSSTHADLWMQSAVQAGFMGDAAPPTETEAALWRGMTPVERAQQFPLAVWELWEDCIECQNIVDATKTPRNAWTAHSNINTNQQHLSLLLPGSSQFYHGDDLESLRGVPPNLPWRQYVQQRQLVQDVTRVLIPLLVWIPPIIGWIPTILAVAAPRQAFTRHFHNAFEQVQFALLEQEQRQVEYESVIRFLCQESSHLFWDQYHFNYFEHDAQESSPVGPQLRDPVGLYHAIFESSSPFNRSRLAGQQGGLDDLPAKYVRHLAMALGLYQSLPGPHVNQVVGKSLVPVALLRAQVRRALFRMVEEDAQLLADGHDQEEMSRLTDQEVVNACVRRNLPIVLAGEENTSIPIKANVSKAQAILLQGPHVVDYQEMRRNLTRHLQYISDVSHEVVSHVEIHYVDKRPEERSEIAKERLGMFAVHVPILQHGYKNRYWQ